MQIGIHTRLYPDVVRNTVCVIAYPDLLNPIRLASLRDVKMQLHGRYISYTYVLAA